MDQLSPLDLTTTQIPRRSSVSDGESGTSRSGSPSLSVTPTPSDISSGDHHFTTKRFLYKYQAQQSESLVNNEDLITYGEIRSYIVLGHYQASIHCRNKSSRPTVASQVPVIIIISKLSSLLSSSFLFRASSAEPESFLQCSS